LPPSSGSWSDQARNEQETGDKRSSAFSELLGITTKNTAVLSKLIKVSCQRTTLRNFMMLAAVIRTAAFWYVTPCTLVDSYQGFGRACSLHLQDEVLGNGM
jgi:uncharacterized membrane protein YkgB